MGDHELTRGLERLEREPENQQAYYDLARLCGEMGRPDLAEQVFRLGIDRMGEHLTRQDYLHGFQGHELDAPTACAYYRALAGVDPRVARQVSTTPPARECGRVLEEAFAADPRPPLAGALDPDPEAVLDRERYRVLYVGPEQSSCNRAFMPSNVTWWVRRTLGAHPRIDSLYFPGDDLLYNPDELTWIERPAGTLERALADLRACCRSFRPDLIVLDGNWLPGRRSLDRETLISLAGEVGARVAVHVPDFYPPLPNFAAYWGARADVLILPRPDRERIGEINGHPQIMLAPGLPFDLDFLGRDARSPKIGQVLFVGSRIRRRDLWCAFLAEAGVPGRYRFTNRTAALSVSFEEYARLHGTSALTLSSGWVEGDLHVVNGRLFEAMAARSVLLLEAGGEYSDWFTPYVHYIPFRTAGELVAWARYLLREPRWRDRVADAAEEHLRGAWSGSRFWTRLLQVALGRTLVKA